MRFQMKCSIALRCAKIFYYLSSPSDVINLGLAINIYDVFRLG